MAKKNSGKIIKKKKSINVEKTQKKSEEICWTKNNKISLKNKKIRKIEMGKKSKKKIGKDLEKKPEKFSIKTEKEYRQNERSFET